MRTKGCLLGGDVENLEFFDFYFDGLERDFLFLAGKFVSGHSSNFLGGKWRWHLLDHALELRGERPERVEIEANLLRRRSGLAVGIISIGGKAEANRAFVGFLGVGIELSEAGEVAENDGQNSCGRRIEGSEMADRALAEDAADAIYDIVRGEAGRFINNKNAVHKLGIW